MVDKWGEGIRAGFMIKKYMFFLFLVSFLAEVHSMPVLRKKVRFTQPDGSSFVAIPYGDEWQNGYETEDGYTILLDKNTGYWVYAVRTEQGELVKSDRIVGISLPELPQHLRPVLPRKPDTVSIVQLAPAVNGPAVPATGNHRVLVILTQFTDRTLSTTEAQWADLVFNSGSFSRVRHFYSEASYNNIDLLPATESCGTANDGVAIATLSYAHPNTSDNTDSRNKTLTKDALTAVNGCVNFASFDDNGDGYISTNELHIVVVVAGYETSYGGAGNACSPGVWAHRWQFYPLDVPSAPVLDGKTLAAYAGNGDYVQVGEWHCSTWDNPGHMATIGTIAHELGHSLWLPDEYDTDGTSNGIGDWGLMGSGSWNYCGSLVSGNCPSHPTVWDKWYLGWLTPTQVTGDGVINIQDFTTNQSAFYLRDNPGGVDWSFGKNSGSGEYFILENRELNGYNAGIPFCGLLIWHIWEGASYQNDANQNEAGRRLIDLREADGLNQLDSGSSYGDPGDPYPGSTNNTVFNYTSNPSSKLYCSSGTGFCNSSGVELSGISGCGSTMSVTVNISEPTLSVIPVQGLNSTGVVGTSNFMPPSKSYTLQNTGVSPLNWTASNSESWITLSSTGGTLLTGESTTVIVSINSNASGLPIGNYNDTVVFTNTTNGNGNTTRSVVLTIVPPPDISVSPASYDFGSVKVNESSSQYFTISNSGNSDLIISSISIYAGDLLSFSVKTGGPVPCATLTPVISAGGSCSVEVIFKPSSPGAKNSTLRIQSNDPDEEFVSVSLSGVGVKIPVAPTGLTASAVSSSSIALVWTDASDNEDGFKIERREGSSGLYSEIATLSSNSSSFTDTGLQPDTLYFYRVLAFNSTGNSGYSNEASATTLAEFKEETGCGCSTAGRDGKSRINAGFLILVIGALLIRRLSRASTFLFKLFI
jgi:M6 family metalloprotease-like protein/MYXO-CTERM domain-containing protein